MPTGLTATLGVALQALFTNTVDVGSASYPVNFSPSIPFTDGAGANQVNKLFSDQRTLAASATEDLDLNGTLLDVFGNAFSPTKIKGIIIFADAGNTNDVIVGGASANQFASMFGAATHTVKIQPGGFLALATPSAAGYALTAGTGDLLKIANSAGGSAVTYTILVIGA